MREAVLREFLKRARTSGPLGQLVLQCVKGGAVNSAQLIGSLKNAGYTVEFEAGKAGHYARVYKPGLSGAEETGQVNIIGESSEPERVLVAFGYSNTEDDAIAQAMWGAVREEEAGVITAIGA